MVSTAIRGDLAIVCPSMPTLLEFVAQERATLKQRHDYSQDYIKRPRGSKSCHH